MAKKREKKILEENYIQAKIASCKKLILGSGFATQRAIYQGYLDYWVSKLDNSITLPDKVFEKVVERLEMPFESQKIIEEKVIEVNTTATTDAPIYFDMGSEGDIHFVDPPLPVKKSITEVIEESQVETLEGIKEVLDDKDVINGNKVRCPQCNEKFTKGAGFSAHYRAKHLEEEVISDKPIETDNS